MKTKMTLAHVWSLLCLLMAASAVTVLYPSINGSETLHCKCPDYQCQKVYWYRLLPGGNKLQFLVHNDAASSMFYGDGIDSNRLKGSHSGTTKIEYALRITGITENDKGFYSCLLISHSANPNDLMPAGYYLRPGEHPPTLAPPTVKTEHKPKPVKPYVCPSTSVKGCKPLVLGIGVGTVLVLAVILVATLYYFSRLPKKCRHGFAKKKHLR